MAAAFRILEVIGALGAGLYLVLNLCVLASRWKDRRRYVPMLLLLIPSMASATTYTADTCNGTADHTKVQTAVNSASDGDTVQIPAGTCTFTGSVTTNNQNVIIQGAGEGVTNLTCNSSPCFDFLGDTKTGYELKNMTMSTNSGALIEQHCFNATALLTGRFNMHHLTLNVSGGGAKIVRIECVAYGVAHHITARSVDGAGILNWFSHIPQNAQDNYPTNPAGHWFCQTYPVELGTDKAFYVEDSDIRSTEYSGINDNVWCGRMVLRHNYFQGPFHLQTHAARTDEIGGAHSEYYNNKHVCVTVVGNPDKECPGHANMRSGTGVIFNETVQQTGGNLLGIALLMDHQRCTNATGCLGITSGAPLGLCNSSNTNDDRIESNGWPCRNQPGWIGPKGAQTNSPIYIWNNGTQDGCSTGGACSVDYNGIDINCSGIGAAPGRMEDYISTVAHSNGMKDYCVGTTTMPASCGTHTNTYTSYTYPHPLQGGGDVTPPAAPTGVSVN